jgi:hypothetical protein
MKNTKQKPSWFDSALSEAASDFAKEMGCKPVSKINRTKIRQSPGACLQESGHSSDQKTDQAKLVT